jgi:uncharacterized protein DUF3349
MGSGNEPPDYLPEGEDLGDKNVVPYYLQDTYEMLKCAYPGGINEEDYIPVLAVLHPHMSNRTLARVLAALTDRDYIYALNETMGFQVGDPLYPFEASDIDRVKEKLMPCGFEEWVNKDTLT